MSGNIIHIDAGKFEQVRQKHCSHKHLTYDVSEQTVQCKDCNRSVAPFQAFMILLNYFKSARDDLKRRQSAVAELEKRANIGLLKATRVVDRAWRSRKMVPTCPHCNEAIFPADGFGTSQINKQIAYARRGHE